MAGMKLSAGLIGQGIAAIGLAGAVTAAVAMAAPQTGFAAWTNLAAVHEANADRHARSAIADPAERTASVADTRASLRQAPATATAWLRLAYLDSLEPSGLSATGNDALTASYSVAPYGPDDTPWRLAFAFNHWSELDTDNRMAALDELRVSRPRLNLRALREAVNDPAGRLALDLSSS